MKNDHYELLLHFSEPMARLELATYPLPWGCSTTELHRHLVGRAGFAPA